MKEQKRQLDQRNRTQRTILIVLIIIVILAALILVVILKKNHSDRPEQYSIDSGAENGHLNIGESIAKMEEDQVSLNALDLVVSSESTVFDDNQMSENSFIHPEKIPVSQFTAIQLPSYWQEHPFEVIYNWSDGKLLLSERGRLSIFDPTIGGDAGEKVLASADYGVQGTANDHYVVYGIGGDEVWELFYYDVRSGETSFFAEDEWGFYGFDLSEDDLFYTLRINYENMVKIKENYVAISVPDGAITVQESLEHRSIKALRKYVPDLQSEWLYEDAHSWSEACCTNHGQLFELITTNVDTKKEVYDYELRMIDPATQEVTTIAKLSNVSETNLRLGRTGISFADRWFENGRWYDVDHEDWTIVLGDAGDTGSIVAGEHKEDDSGWLSLYKY